MTHPARTMPFVELYSGLKAAVERGEIYQQIDEETGLHLFTYSEETIYERKWNKFTLLARGLIIHPASKTIVATPFPKFFNYGECNSILLPYTDNTVAPLAIEDWPEVPVTIPDQPFKVFEKLDGSLIIVYWWDGKWRCATKGSFKSDQAKWAQNWLDSHIISAEDLTKGSTYLFEAIYPENRIVVNYEGMRGLSLLGAYYESGEEYSYGDLKIFAECWGIDIAHQDPFDSISELLTQAKELDHNTEGWVVRFEDGTRIKIKGDEYCRIHRMVSNLTPLALWKTLRDEPDKIIEIRRAIPEEFWQDFDQIIKIISGKVNELEVRIQNIVATLTEMTDKEIGLSLNTFPEDVRKFIFPARKGNLLVGRTRWAMFESIRPTRNTLEGYNPSRSINRIQEE